MIRVFTAFSGYDSQCLALNVLRGEEDNPIIHSKDGYMYIFDYELVGWSEIDKYAIKAHNALFPQWADRNYGDISKIDWSAVPDFDLFTYSSPCQDFSQAGKQRGADKGSGTRSSLLWECERAIATKRPKYLLFENVAAVVSKKFIRLFNEWQLTLERMGYGNFVQVLNAKTHGYPTPVPQNRERVFMVSILDCTQAFYFPDAQPLTQRLADVLEPEVDESFYLSPERIKGMIASTKKEQERGNRLAFSQKIAEIHPGQNGNVYDANAISPTICASEGYKTNTKIAVLGWTRDAKGEVVDRHPVDVANAVTAAKRDNTQNYVIQQRGHGFVQDSEKELCPTITGKTFNYNNTLSNGYRIRKLTPRECFRLMGVRDEDIDRIQAAGISKSQQYKMAGNSIVVNCLAAIFRQLFIGNFNKYQQTEIFN